MFTHFRDQWQQVSCEIAFALALTARHLAALAQLKYISTRNTHRTTSEH